MSIKYLAATLYSFLLSGGLVNQYDEYIQKICFNPVVLSAFCS